MAVLTIIKGRRAVHWQFDAPQPLDALLAAAGFRQARPCGGRGSCGKCAVEVFGAVSDLNPAEWMTGKRLACQTVALGDAQVILPDVGEMDGIQIDSHLQAALGQPMPGRTGAAVDIGTTTIALRRYDLQTGRCLGESAMENPQVSVAADVIGRIGAAMNGELENLRRMVLNAIETLLMRAGGMVDSMVVTGNTTMLYLLTGRETACLSCLPFEADTLFDVETEILGAKAYLPPCVNAFVGADISCAVLASGMCENRTALLCDVGTNGEVALWKDGVLHVTSTAAGPAFEGAGISCGCSSVPGAIDRVWTRDGRICIHTIGGEPAVGLCGSGLIDAVAEMLSQEWMDETGAMDDDILNLAPGVNLLQKDIRAVQLAKAAIAAGIQSLMEVSGAACEEIDIFYIAGGFGSRLNLESAARIGLFPGELLKKAQVIGNGALAGAAQLLLDRGKLAQARAIQAKSRHLNLGGNPRFNENYMEQMIFPVEE